MIGSITDTAIGLGFGVRETQCGFGLFNEGSRAPRGLFARWTLCRSMYGWVGAGYLVDVTVFNGSTYCH